MEFRQLGPFRVSLVGLGCNNFGGRIPFEATERVVARALDAGITLFDTADSYGESGGSEKALGALLGPRRKDIVLATKFGLGGGGSRRHAMAACEASLKRLNTDWIDFYQLHRPDPRTPIEETLRALDDLVHQGKVRAIGCSNLSAAQVDEAQATSQRLKLASFVSCQDEYSLLAREIEAELVPAIERHGLTLLPYFPLASGMLTGKYRRGAKPPPGTRLSRISNHADRFLNDANFALVEQLEAFAAARGHSLLDLAFSWLAARPYVASVIAGATKPEQIDANIKAVGWQLTPAEVAEIDRLSAPA
jgi:aryl-alcohol dehydrogenase-like predicted oxidoreductase